MNIHPNQRKAQAAWDGVAHGDLGDPDDFAHNLIVENGPGAGPWRHVQGETPSSNSP